MDCLGLPGELAEKLFTIIGQLSGHRDLDRLLIEIQQSILDLIRGADFVCIYIYNSDLDALVPVSGVGFDFPTMSTMHIRPGESMTGMAYSLRESLLFATPAEIIGAWDSLLPEHDLILRAALGRPVNSLRSYVCSPLMIDRRVIGVIGVGNYESERSFDLQDLRVTSVFAEHAAVAMKNAMEIRRLESLTDELQEALSVQRRLLTDMEDHGDGLAGLTFRLQDLIGKPVKVITTSRKELFSSGSASAEGDTEFTIRHGNQCVGYLGVCDPLSSTDKFVIELALPLYAMELLKVRSNSARRLRTHSEFLEAILRNDELAIAAQASKFNLKEASHWRVVSLEFINPDHDRDGDFYNVMTENFSCWDSRVFVVGELADKLVLIIDSTVACADWRAFVDAHISSQTLLIWGVEGHGIQNLFQSLRRLLEVRYHVGTRVDASDRLTVVCGRDYPEASLFASIDRVERDSYIRQVLGSVLEDDILLRTLLIWSRSNRNYAKVAEAMFTHVNTVRYRVQKIQDIIGRDIRENGEEWMRVQLACALLAGKVDDSGGR